MARVPANKMAALFISCLLVDGLEVDDHCEDRSDLERPARRFRKGCATGNVERKWAFKATMSGDRPQDRERVTSTRGVLSRSERSRAGGRSSGMPDALAGRSEEHTS